MEPSKEFIRLVVGVSWSFDRFEPHLVRTEGPTTQTERDNLAHALNQWLDRTCVVNAEHNSDPCLLTIRPKVRRRLAKEKVA